MERPGVIRAEGLCVGYRLGGRGEKPVHRDLSFSLREGELTCLLGPNGAGKSTLLRTLGGTLPPLQGRVFLRGRPLGDYSEQRRSGLLGVVLTDKTYAGGLRVSELVALGRHPYTGFFGRLSAEDRRMVDESMEAVGMTGKAGSYVSELSDGERQKAMIAKVLAQQCPVILLDEPTAYLDIISRIEIMNLLHLLTRTQHKTVLLSTHDIGQTLQWADRLWLLSRRNGLLCGVTEDLVLGDAMDRFFSRGGIAFDKADGSFRCGVGQRPRIAVRCDDATLLFWTKNALIRNGFAPDTAPDSDASVVLCVSAPDRIEIGREDGSSRHCDSLGEMIECLNRTNHG